jgi:hypothetical protein
MISPAHSVSWFSIALPRWPQPLSFTNFVHDLQGVPRPISAERRWTWKCSRRALECVGGTGRAATICSSRRRLLPAQIRELGRELRSGRISWNQSLPRDLNTKKAKNTPLRVINFKVFFLQRIRWTVGSREVTTHEFPKEFLQFPWLHQKEVGVQNWQFNPNSFFFFGGFWVKKWFLQGRYVLNPGVLTYMIDTNIN